MFVFSLPDSVRTRSLNMFFLNHLWLNPEWFYDDFQIGSVYGVPMFCIWNGNRAFNTAEFTSCGRMKDIFGMYKGFGVDYRLTYTNFMVQEKHLSDIVGNKMAELLNDFGGGVTLSTYIMAEYMLQHYPNLKIGWSVTTDYGEDKIIKINTLTKAGMIVILPIEFNNNWEMLEQVENRDNIEILINENCVDNCPKRREHFERSNRAFLLEDDGIEFGRCFYPSDKYPDLPRTRCIPRQDFGKYAAQGFNHFKVAGREGGVYEPVEATYLNLFVRPQYREQVGTLYEESKTKK